MQTKLKPGVSPKRQLKNEECINNEAGIIFRSSRGQLRVFWQKPAKETSKF